MSHQKKHHTDFWISEHVKLFYLVNTRKKIEEK